MNDHIIWNGKNTEEVVRFCYDHQPNLCGIHNVFKNCLTGVKTLEVEPADIMRCSSLYVPVGSLCEAVHTASSGNFVRIHPPVVFPSVNMLRILNRLMPKEVRA